MSIRVFVADDHAVVRRGLQSFLATEPDIEVIGEAENGREAVREISRLIASGEAPDVVLMDLVMPELDGVGAALELRELPGAPRVVMMTSFGEVEHLRAALQAGVSGYLLKDSGAENVAAAVRAAYSGQLHLDAKVSAQLSQALAPVPPDGAAGLTPRERDVVVLVARGQSNKDIARALFISERTARTHVSHLLGKMGLQSRIQLALWALEHGFGRADI
jgi:DNA-binding NarL/FixJ family response regulator